MKKCGKESEEEKKMNEKIAMPSKDFKIENIDHISKKECSLSYSCWITHTCTSRSNCMTSFYINIIYFVKTYFIIKYNLLIFFYFIIYKK